jgi:hypothetical protein
MLQPQQVQEVTANSDKQQVMYLQQSPIKQQSQGVQSMRSLQDQQVYPPPVSQRSPPRSHIVTVGMFNFD